MWYEILPSAGIVFAAIAIPGMAGKMYNYFFYNGKVVSICLCLCFCMWPKAKPFLESRLVPEITEAIAILG